MHSANACWQQLPEDTQQSFEGSDGNMRCAKGFGKKPVLVHA